MSIYEKIDQLQFKINELRPFDGHLLAQIRAYYRIGLTWSSNALEGNTLTESETKVLLEDGLTAGGKPLRDTFEALGHAKAYDFMFSLMRNKSITERDVLTLHELFYSGIEPQYAGRYRDMEVLITGSLYPVTSPDNIADEMKRLCQWIVGGGKTYHPVGFAAQLHKKFIFIHPFKDGNGRVARLLTNAVLIQNGYIPVIIPPVLRNEYIALLEKARTDDRPFVEFIARREEESQRDILRLLNVPMRA